MLALVIAAIVLLALNLIGTVLVLSAAGHALLNLVDVRDAIKFTAEENNRQNRANRKFWTLVTDKLLKHVAASAQAA